MQYLHYIGIDVSKNWFDIAIFKEKFTENFENNVKGIAAFIAKHRSTLEKGLVVLEATGGYETALLHALCEQNIAVHRASGYKTRHFANSLGKKTKTDALDAQTLARYSYERCDTLSIYRPPSHAQQRFMQLSSRRDDLIAMRVQESNRAQHVNMAGMAAYFTPILTAIEQALQDIDAELAKIVEQDAEMSLKVEVLCELKGIAKVTAHILLSHMPELGQLTRREVASLAGVAPHERSSGKKTGYARVFGGRTSVKTALYRAVWSASRYNPQIKPFYDNLIAQGKPKMVALCACSRKLIVIANAKIRDKINEIKHINANVCSACG